MEASAVQSGGICPLSDSMKKSSRILKYVQQATDGPRLRLFKTLRDLKKAVRRRRGGPLRNQSQHGEIPKHQAGGPGAAGAAFHFKADGGDDISGAPRRPDLDVWSR